MKYFDNFTKNVDNLGIIIVATGFEKLAKVQQITQSGHTGRQVGWGSLLKRSTVIKRL